MEWVELYLPAAELADEVAALLVQTDEVAAQGACVRGDDVVIWAPAAEAEAARRALALAAERLRAAGLPVDPAAIRVVPAPPEDEWRDAWKRHFKVTRFGSRIVIVPSWESYAPASGEVILDLDPVRAFGTGAHASTRLCLVLLERLHDRDAARPERFLDVGTGSGILSVAAAKLWPTAHGVAVDTDPLAVSAARENLDRNGVGERVVVGDDVATVGGDFEVVLANIQADVLLALLDTLVARLAPGGWIVLSGLLSEQAPAVAEAYVRAGLTQVRTSRLDEDPAWSAVVLRRG